MPHLIYSRFKVVLMLSLNIAVYNDGSQSTVLTYMPQPKLKDTDEIQTNESKYAGNLGKWVMVAGNEDNGTSEDQKGDNTGLDVYPTQTLCPTDKER
ncbi:hypothetical protein llap_1078 [Limosa lapponica baueri]|uniref:Uncharacterized protein n=1 Tax=Limosa lapponica baueri TaxID=1758121 RepID=A0A2I0URH4_LIMLA|nr:hypothetical protein llap_1078 [Limosa lapponica baueri]